MNLVYTALNQHYGVIILMSLFLLFILSPMLEQNMLRLTSILSETVAKKSLFIRHILPTEQIADVMTKALMFTTYHWLHDKLTIVPPLSLRGVDNT